jgi:glycosyltransferase involved in cell wall biosynthesis
MPKISVITPTYKTPDWVLARTWASLKAQTFTDWEWVVYDDSDNPNVRRQLYGYQGDERYKITVMSSTVHSGVIGHVKRVAFMAAQGDILVELDHDDELTPTALADIVAAFDNETVGFAFSDWCEILPNGQSGIYPDGWGLGYGVKYWTGNVWGLSIPTINATTLSHIVSVPNHVRSWRATSYRALNGHDPQLPIADDYDLIIRTVLDNNWAHIPKVLYRQHVGAHTAQRQRNKAIQETVAQLYAHHLPAITAKFGES